MIRTTFRLATIAALTSAVGTAALADTGEGYISNVTPNVWVVKSNGQSYTGLAEAGNITIWGKLNYDTGTAGKVKSWSAYPVIGEGVFEVAGTAFYKKSESYPVGQRPKSIHPNLIFPINASVFEPKALLMCGMRAESLRNQGKSDAQIFGQNHDLKIKVKLNYSVDANGAGSNNPILEYSAPYEVTVRCAKWTGARVPSANTVQSQPVQVKKATLKLDEIANLQGTCAVKTVTAISTSAANATIKYRFVHSSGNKSQVYTTKTAGNMIAVVNHTHDVPNGAGPEQGWFQIEGVAPGFNSNKASYSMQCKSGGKAGGFSSQPAKPKPGGTLRLKVN